MIPEFSGYSKMDGIVKIKHCSPDGISLWLLDGCSGITHNAIFSKEQFKQFADGVAKIKKWLENE